MTPRQRPVAALVLAVLTVLWVTPAQVGAEADPRVYAPPVEAPVIDPFRPPAQPWLPGNRGLEYATVVGSQVRSIGPGVVVFAGPVAGRLYVTVAHPDGLRSSYSYLAAVRASVGDVLAGGDVVGVAGVRFHVGVRRGDTYIDPASLWGTRVVGGRVRLVPTDGAYPPSRGPQPGPGPPPGTGLAPTRSPGARRSLASVGPDVALVGIGLARVAAPMGR